MHSSKNLRQVSLFLVPGLSVWITFCMVLCAAWALSAPHAGQAWEPVGPGGGSFIGFVTDPLDADVITAVTTDPSTANVYHSTDGGLS
jgi:hypothetical protein